MADQIYDTTGSSEDTNHPEYTVSAAEAMVESQEAAAASKVSEGLSASSATAAAASAEEAAVSAASIDTDAYGIVSGVDGTTQWTKFPDGTMLLSTQSYSSATASVLFVYPAEVVFVGISRVATATVSTTTEGNFTAQVSSTGTTQLYFSVFDSNDVRAAKFTNIHIVGRWK